MQKYLNLCCGNNPVPSTDEVEMVNVDIAIDNPLITKFDVTVTPYPLQDLEFDRIYMFHAIEHIPEELHGTLLKEFRRILKDEGQLVFAYPEFSAVIKRWQDAVGDDRDFWKHTIYGRGTTEWDRHKALMDTVDFAKYMSYFGWHMVGAAPEKGQEFNTVVVCMKAPFPLTYERLLEKEFA